MTNPSLKLKSLLSGALIIVATLPHGGMAEERNLFGTLHGHSNWSIDAFGIGNTSLGPEKAYEFARGQTVTHLNGAEMTLGSPLDFFMLSDHAEMLGTAPGLITEGSPVYNTEVGELARAGKATEAFTLIGNAMISGEPLKGFDDPEVAKTLWQEYVELADRYNEPGTFTAFRGYEWTSLPGAANMHRNIIFRGDKTPEVPFTAMDSDKPEKLWDAMDQWRKDDIEVFAISHNGNGSVGKMFGLLDSDGALITKEWAMRRNANEPQHEAGQVKGVSMAHPMFSPNDDFANFEIWNRIVPNGGPAPALRGNYVREGWKIGLGMKYQLDGVNAYMLGVSGGSDTHGTINTFEEFNNAGNHVNDATLEQRRSGLPGQSLGKPGDNLFINPGTLTGVWVEENTRAEIYDALERRESYATSGTRIAVRLYAGYDFPEDLMSHSDWVQRAGKLGAPMGAEIDKQNRPLSIAIHAMKAPESANLDRIQVIKLWSDGFMEHEKIYDVALSGGRQINAATGKAEPVVNTVDVTTATYSNEHGATELITLWTDPDGAPEHDAVYYVRVLEIPTPRWSTYDAVKMGLPPSDLVPATIQERAWTSPVWLTTKN